MKALTLIFLLLAHGVAGAAEPFARASIDDGGGIAPGQQVHVFVDVFVPDFFVSPPQFPLFEAAGSLVTMTTGSGLNLLQTIDGVQYAGIRRAYAVVPETSGRFTLPEITIEVGYRQDGKPTKRQVTVALPEFEVADIRTDRAAPAYSAADLTLSQSFDADPKEMKTGGALARTIAIVARETQAMLIPPIDPGTATGLKQYVKPPILRDGIDLDGGGRGTEPASSRTQIIVYTAANEGSFDIPAIAYAWFDVDAHSVRTATLPAITVSVAKEEKRNERIRPDVDQEETAGKPWTSVAWSALVVGILIAVVGWSAGRSQPLVAAMVARQMERFRNSRAVRLRRLRSVIKAGTPSAIYSALQTWSRQLGYRSISDWVFAEGDTRLEAQVEILNEELFGGQEVRLDRAVLFEVVETHVGRAAPKRSRLPPLNPAASAENH
ncbi:BatD family protein [Rhizobium laguerreae]|uniref:BatD family protein n=1 Tax=Rhizobium laguerreae TaxID=1076926 RepID=UPI00103DF8BD|nr:BatD family protein [Rhizobium laguerreae]TBY08166.1 hypothetical protein E0J21_14300 [Rhizobium laguerreae]